jgi:predicted NBD/HSP70 family sugar kinase
MSLQRTSGLGTNQEAVRRHNLGTLLRHVHGAGQISRAELTTLMGLNRSTIAGLVAELESLGITQRAVPVGARTSAGRPSAEVRVAGGGPYVIAVDLGVDRAVVAGVGLGGVVMERAQAPIDNGGEAWQVGASVAGLIRTVVADVSASAPLVGIGVSVPGLVRRSDGLIRLAPNLEWNDVSFAGIVLAALGLDIPVSLANDANLGALAEHRRGAGIGVDDLIYVSGNVGVGAGIITGGVQLEGAGGYAGEVGHLQFNPSGKLCHCGNLGCWETEVGAHAIARAISCPESEVAQLGEVLQAYHRTPPELRSTGTALGRGLASIVNAFNPRLVVLGGYLSSLYTLVRNEVDAGLAERALPAPLESVTLSLPGLGLDSVLLGAAEIAFEPLFVDPVAALGNALVDVRALLAG